MKADKTDVSLWARAVNSRNAAVEKGISDLTNVGAFIATEMDPSEMVKNQLTQLEALKKAEPYHWEPDVLKLAVLSGKELPQDVVFHRGWLHSDAGWWWFGQNPPIIGKSAAEAKGTRVRINALLYFLIPEEKKVRLVSFTFDHDEPTPGPVPIGIITWPEGVSLNKMLRAVNHLETDTEAKNEHKNVRLDVSVVDGNAYENADAAPINNFDTDWAYTTAKTLWLFAAGSLWMQQKIIVTNEVHLPKSVRREAKRLQVTSKSYVVQLRRKEYAPREEQGTVDWHYRWVVRGHWRNQPYGDGQKKWIFIHPFIKGPEGKPLKTPIDRVFHVVR